MHYCNADIFLMHVCGLDEQGLDLPFKRYMIQFSASQNEIALPKIVEKAVHTLDELDRETLVRRNGADSQR